MLVLHIVTAKIIKEVFFVARPGAFNAIELRSAYGFEGLALSLALIDLRGLLLETASHIELT